MWREIFPEIAEFVDSTECQHALDPYGQTYYNHLDEAWELYGKDGLGTQLLYMSSNLFHGNALVAKKLVEFYQLVDSAMLY